MQVHYKTMGPFAYYISDEKLNAEGGMGWELVYISPYLNDHRGQGYFYTYKRVY